jgi:HSP20 family protein
MNQIRSIRIARFRVQAERLKAGEQPSIEEAMAKAETKVSVTTEEKPATPASAAMQAWRPFETLRREVDRLFEDFSLNPFRLPLRRPAFDLEPFWQAESWVATPAIDLVERDNAFEMSAELPGLDEKNIEVNLANGILTIKGQKEEDKVEKKEDFHLRERRFCSFARSVRVPDTVDADKIEASFKKGVLTVTLPKKPEAQKPVKKIEVKGD